jgi:CubicO group peptidase (beta-lactamase class C family)
MLKRARFFCIDFGVAAAMLLVLGAVIRADDAESLRIRRIENGLTPEAWVQGGPLWTLEERMAHYGVPGVSIAVIHDFEVAWAKGYGVRDAEKGGVVTPETLFQAASISKPFAAAAALQLVEAGVLQLDEDVNRKLTTWKVPENEYTVEEKVTLRRLITHTAGLTVSGFRGYAPGEPVPGIEQVLEGAPPANSAPVRVDTVPGTLYRYSGGGYTVLQLLLEDVTGRPLPDLVQEKVMAPAGMTRSSFRKPLSPELARLTSSAHDRSGVPHPGHWFLDNGSCCCGLWTTPTDLARFAITVARAARGEPSSVLSEEMARAMITPLVENRMGLGFGLEGRDAKAYFSHGGGNPGFSCRLIMHREAGYGAAVMTNSDDGYRLYSEILRAIAREYGWQNYPSSE